MRIQSPRGDIRYFDPNREGMRFGDKGTLQMRKCQLWEATISSFFNVPKRMGVCPLLFRRAGTAIT